MILSGYKERDCTPVDVFLRLFGKGTGGEKIIQIEGDKME